MRILLLVDSYLPSRRSGAKQIHDLAAELHRRGHEATVLAPSDEISRRLEITLEDGIRVVRARTGRIKGASRAWRAYREAQLPAKLWRKAGRFLRGNPCDLVIFYSPTIFFSPLVQRLKARWGCASYLILRDLFPQWAVDTGLLRRGPVLSYFRWKERRQYAAADIIAIQSKGDLEYFSGRLEGSNCRLEVLYNWSELEEAGLPITNFRSRLGLQDKIVFFYGGNLGVAQDMENIVRLAANVSGEALIYFLIVGDGAAARQVKESIARRGLKNIGILPPVGQREYLAMVREFDFGLVTLDGRLKTHNVPGKFLSYLYWGKPVLASINSGNDLFDLLCESHAGVCLANGHDEALAAAAIRLAGDRSLRTAMGNNARRLLERTFSVEAAAQQILSHFPGTTGLPDRKGTGRGARPVELAVGNR